MSDHDRGSDSPNRKAESSLWKLTDWQKNSLAASGTTLGVTASVYQFLAQFLPGGLAGIILTLIIAAAGVAVVFGCIKLIPGVHRSSVPAWQALLAILVIGLLAGGGGYLFRTARDGSTANSARPRMSQIHAAGPSAGSSATSENPASPEPVPASASVSQSSCGRPDLVLPTSGPPTFTIEVHPGCAPAAGVTRWIVVEVDDVGAGTPHSEYYFVWKVAQTTVYTLKPNIDNCSKPRSYYIVDATDAQYTAAIKTGRTSDRLATDLGDIPVESPIHNYQC